MADQMQASGAARPPPHSLHVAPSARYTSSTATLGTSTARSKLLGRRARGTLQFSQSSWARELHLLLLMWFCESPVGRNDASTVRVIADARPFHAGRPLPPPYPLAPRLHLCTLRSPRALLALSSAADGCPIFLLSKWSPPGLITPSPPAPRGPALSAWTSSYTTTSASPPAILAPLFSAPPVHSRRKAMAPAYPDARKGSCQNGLSFNRSHQCSPNVPHRSPACQRIAHILHLKCASC